MADLVKHSNKDQSKYTTPTYPNINESMLAQDRTPSTAAFAAGGYYKDASGGYTFGANPHSSFEHPTQNNLSPVQGDN